MHRSLSRPCRFTFLPLLLSCMAAQAQTNRAAPESVVISASPLPGSSLDPDKLPVSVDVLTPAEISRFGAPDLLRALANEAPGVTFSDAQDNPFQPNLSYRGFEASPLSGNAQGLAVYAGGVRLNHPFGDTVDWDLIPETAIANINIESTNPVFGLNALGGSIAMQFKNGFGFNGNELFAGGGSFGRVEGGFQSGAQDGNIAFYAAGEARSESGWRQHSPSNLYRLFADFNARGADWQLQLDLLGAHSDLTGNGVAPVELLHAARSAVFTYPDNTRNTFGLANLEASVALSDTLSVNGNLYSSRFDQQTLNGDAGNVSPCGAQPIFLCLDNGDTAVGADGGPITAFPVELAYGQLNRTGTGTTAFGAALEANWNAAILAFPSRFVAGAAWDAGRTGFSASTALGGLSRDRGFVGTGVIVEQPDGLIAPVLASSSNDYFGIYAAEQLDLTTALSLTLSGRYNVAHIAVQDRRGAALTGTHDYAHLNPAVGLTYVLDPALSVYAGYSGANRAPTPAEFSCAAVNTPCSLTNFFVADPPLKQVTAQNIEAGLRGSANVAPFAGIRWQLAVFRTDLQNDIQFVASPIVGRGFFENVGGTRRQGAEFGLNAAAEFWSLSLDYSYTKASFRSALILNSPDNPLADENGQIAVRPGDRLPAIPAHVVKTMLDIHATRRLEINFATRAASGVYLRGDEANLNPKTPGYIVFDLGATYRISDQWELFGSVSNLLNAKYATFGAFSPTADVPLMEAPGAGDPHSLSPAPPRWLSAGIKLNL